MNYFKKIWLEHQRTNRVDAKLTKALIDPSLIVRIRIGEFEHKIDLSTDNLNFWWEAWAQTWGSLPAGQKSQKEDKLGAKAGY